MLKIYKGNHSSRRLLVFKLTSKGQDYLPGYVIFQRSQQSKGLFVLNTEEICVQPKQTVGKWNGEGDWSSWWWFCFGAWCQGQKHKKTHFSKWGCLRRMLLLQHTRHLSSISGWGWCSDGSINLPFLVFGSDM